MVLEINNTKRIQEQVQLSGKGDPLGIVQKLKFHHTNKWYMYKSKSVLENEMHRIN